MEFGIRPPEHVMPASGDRELIVMVCGRLGRLVEGVESLGVWVRQVVHSGGRGSGRSLVLVVMRGGKGRWEIRRLEVRVLVRPRHGVGRRGVGRGVPVVMMVVVRRAEGRRPTSSPGPDGRDRPMARQPVLKQRPTV